MARVDWIRCREVDSERWVPLLPLGRGSQVQVRPCLIISNWDSKSSLLVRVNDKVESWICQRLLMERNRGSSRRQIWVLRARIFMRQLEEVAQVLLLPRRGSLCQVTIFHSSLSWKNQAILMPPSQRRQCSENPPATGLSKWSIQMKVPLAQMPPTLDFSTRPVITKAWSQ